MKNLSEEEFLMIRMSRKMQYDAVGERLYVITEWYKNQYVMHIFDLGVAAWPPLKTVSVNELDDVQFFFIYNTRFYYVDRDTVYAIRFSNRVAFSEIFQGTCNDSSY